MGACIAAALGLPLPAASRSLCASACGSTLAFPPACLLARLPAGRPADATSPSGLCSTSPSPLRRSATRAVAPSLPPCAQA